MKISRPYPFTRRTLPISPISSPSLYSLSLGRRQRSTAQHRRGCRRCSSLGFGLASPLFPSLYPLSRLPPLLPTRCRSWGRVSDVANLAAMSHARFQRRVAQRRCGRHHLRFSEIQLGEPLFLPAQVHGVAATPEALDTHGGSSQDPADP